MSSGKLGLDFWLWLIGFLRAIGDWLSDVGPETHEHVDGPDAAPAPKRPSRPSPPVNTGVSVGGNKGKGRR